jgi:integrase
MAYMPPVVADMVRLQLLTGARPGEVCAMRVRDLDMSRPVWTYKPERHKTAWRGHKRNIAIGPRAQEIVRKYLKAQLEAYLYSPAEADRQRKEEMRKNRKSPVQPSQLNRAKKDARRKPGGAVPRHFLQLRHSPRLHQGRRAALAPASTAVFRIVADRARIRP